MTPASATLSRFGAHNFRPWSREADRRGLEAAGSTDEASRRASRKCSGTASSGSAAERSFGIAKLSEITEAGRIEDFQELKWLAYDSGRCVTSRFKFRGVITLKWPKF